MIWAGHTARMGKKRNAYKVLEDKPERKRPLGKSTRRWKDDIKIVLKRYTLEPFALDSSRSG
jgi:hypothetical protein